MGRGTGVDFTIDDTVPFEIVERSLREYLLDCRGLYSSGAVSVNVGRRILAPDQLAAIKEILDRETGLTVTRYWCAPEILQAALSSPPSPPLQSSPSPTISLDRENGTGRPVAGQETDFAVQSQTTPETTLETVIETAPETLTGETPAGADPTAAPIPETDHSAAKSNVRQLSMAFTDLEPPAAAESPEVVEVEVVELPESPELPTAAAAETSLADIQNTGDSAENAETVSVADDQSVAPEDNPDTAPIPPAPRRGNEALLIKTTCRSGELIRYSGDVVVYGDVNPGAEIVAAGDIVVLGALRGIAHAGADGDPKATIFALNLESHRLQIGSQVGEAPASVRRSKSSGRAPAAKIAYLRRGSVFVAPFDRRREQYQGGVLYEG